MSAETDLPDNVITKDYLIKILEHHHHNNKVDLIGYQVESAAAKGENYASVILRVRLEYKIRDGIDDIGDEVHKLSLIVKTKTDNVELDDLLTDLSVFKKEEVTYTVILSEVGKLLQGHGDCVVLSPELIFADDQAIVLEDLASKGYHTKNRIDRLDLAHSKVVLTKLAKYHAATSVIYKQKPELFKYHVRSPLGDTETILDFFYQNSMKEMIAAVASHPTLQKYTDRLKAFAATMIAKEKEILKGRGDLLVNNHGDMWINNTLWRHSPSGSIEDVLLVDHQEGQVCSPGYDLNHFIATSCDMTVQTQHFEELVRHYHHELVMTMTLLHVDRVPTLDEIYQELKSTASHGLIATAAVTPILLIENKEYANAMLLMSDDEAAQAARKVIYSNPKYTVIINFEFLLPKHSVSKI